MNDAFGSEIPDCLIAVKPESEDLAIQIAKMLYPEMPLDVYTYDSIKENAQVRAELRGRRAALINNVITTGRTCLEVHSIASMICNVVCWATIIDRTFGPGPVPVIASHTGEPVVLMEQF